MFYYCSNPFCTKGTVGLRLPDGVRTCRRRASPRAVASGSTTSARTARCATVRTGTAATRPPDCTRQSRYSRSLLSSHSHCALCSELSPCALCHVPRRSFAPFLWPRHSCKSWTLTSSLHSFEFYRQNLFQMPHSDFQFQSSFFIFIVNIPLFPLVPILH